MEFEKFKYNGISWYGDKEAVKEFFSLPNEVLVRERAFRNVNYRSLTEDSKPLFFIKADPSYNFTDKLKSIFRTRLRNEFDSANALQNAGVPVVDHVAVGTKGRESFLITRAFNGDSVASLFHQLDELPSDKRKYIISEFCHFLCKFIENSFYHPDLHLDNILYSFENGNIKFINIDVYGVKKQELSEKKIAEMFSYVFSLFDRYPRFETREYFSVLEKYLTSYSFEQFLILRKEIKIKAALKFTKKRQRKFIDDGTRVSSWSKTTVYYTAMRDVEQNFFMNLIDKLNYVDGVQTVGGKQFYVKAKTVKNIQRTWLNLLFLRRFGIPVINLIGYTKSRVGSLLVAECNEFKVYDDKSSLLNLGYLLANIHHNRISIDNLSFDNFLIHADGKNIKVVAVDKVKFNHNFASLEKRVTNIKFFIDEVKTEYSLGQVSKFEVLRMMVIYARTNQLASRAIVNFLIPNS